ncbi:MAG: hypothetical protein JXA89_15670 [Anaerolineae bacterium]|nr:hypothetical protein [Anaerolineae bacterium]
MRASLPAEIDVELDLDDDLPLAQADPRQIGQVLDHLIRNAVQVMSLVFVDRAPGSKNTKGRLTMTTMPQGQEKVMIAVRDTGAGIAPEHAPRIFEPLFTTRAKGMGLGLAFARLLMQGHGGDITFTSQAGEGSTFTVCLPVAHP